MSNESATPEDGEAAAPTPARKTKQVCISIPQELRGKLDAKKSREGYKSLAAVICRLLTTHPEMRTA